MPSVQEKWTANSPVSSAAANGGAMRSRAGDSQMAICVRPTAPTPISLPASISLGLTVASITSKMREVFS